MLESKFKNFNHLKVHTQYSICEGAIKIDDLKEYTVNDFKLANYDHYPAIKAKMAI